MHFIFNIEYSVMKGVRLMGMPVINASDTSRNQAITDVLESIALAEAALAHILNAEGENLQYIVQQDCMCVDQLIEVHCCIQKTLEAASNFENALQNKLKALFNESC